MKTFHLVVWTGPTMVAPIANEFRRAGLTVVCEGTERIHVLVESDSWDNARFAFLIVLNKELGKTFGFKWSDIQVLRESIAHPGYTSLPIA